MPQRHQSTKLHKVYFMSIFFFVNPLCFRAFVAKFDTLYRLDLFE